MKTRIYQVVCLSMIALLALSAYPFYQAGPVQAGSNGVSEAGSSLYLPLVGTGLSGSQPPPSQQWTDGEKSTIHSIALNAGYLGKLAEDDPGNPSTETITQTINGEDYWVDVGTNYVVKNKSDILFLGTNDDVIWPGALIEGDQAHDFVYTPITIPRAPVTLSVNLENVHCAGGLTRTVADPKLSTTREGIRLLLQQARQGCEIVPAQAQFSLEQVYDESSLNLALGGNVDTSAVDLSAKLNWNDISKRNKIIAKYQQVLYEINIDTPVTQADFFDKSRTSVAAINAAMPPGSDPMYVAGVKYGMMALMFFESNYSDQTVRAAIDTSIRSTISATITGTLTAKTVLDASKIEIVVYGGSTAGLVKLSYSGTQGFNDVIRASSRGGYDSPGVPLLYKFRNFSDNNLAMITFTSDYAFSSNFFPVEPRIAVVLDNFEILRGYTEDFPFITIYEMDDMIMTVNAKNRSSFGDPGTDIYPLNQQKGTWTVVNVPLDSPGNHWPSAPMDPIYLFYDNRHQPFDWRYATLSVKGQVDQLDIWPDATDHGEYTRNWISGNDLLAGLWDYDESVTPFIPYSFDFPVTDTFWNSWKMDVRLHFRIYLLNRYP